MEIKLHRKRPGQFILGLLIALFVVFVGLGLVVARLGSLFVNPELEIARATENALTLSHGAEVRLAIQTFIDTNWSFAAFKNPQLLAKVAAGQELKALQALNFEWSSNRVDVMGSSIINKVQVIDYTPTQLKAFSCETLNFNTVTIDGIYVSAEKPLTAFRMYVFQRESGVWKVAALADFTDADHINRDWTEGSFPQWEKDLIGDLPNLIDRYDSCFSP